MTRKYFVVIYEPGTGIPTFYPYNTAGEEEYVAHLLWLLKLDWAQVWEAPHGDYNHPDAVMTRRRAFARSPDPSPGTPW